MLNQITLVGRIVELKKEKESTIMVLGVPRSFKNSEGVYETDFISIRLLKTMAESVQEYCKKGDVVAIRGRVQARVVEDNGETTNIMEIVAEKVTFLTSRKEEKED